MDLTKENLIGDLTERIADGDLTREKDEKGADGVWDLADDLVNDRGLLVADEEASPRERVYHAIWLIIEEVKEKKADKITKKLM